MYDGESVGDLYPSRRMPQAWNHIIYIGPRLHEYIDAVTTVASV